MKIHAKKLLNKSPLEIKANMRGNGFEVIFEDGVSITMSAGDIVTARYYWEFVKKFKMRLTSDMCFVSKYENGFYSSGTHNDMLSYMYRVYIQQYIIPNNLLSFDAMEIAWKELTDIVNRLFSELQYNVLEHGVCLSIVDYVELQRDPALSAAIEAGVKDPTNPLHIDNINTVIKDLLLRHPENNLAKLFNCGASNKTQVGHSIGLRGFTTDINNMIYPEAVTENLVRGLSSFYDMACESSVMNKALKLQEFGIRHSEWLQRELHLSGMIIRSLILDDCGQRNYKEWYVKDLADLALLEGTNFLYNGVETELEVSKHKDVIGTVIMMRRINECNHLANGHVCWKCLGAASYSIPEGASVSHILLTIAMAVIGQLMLSAKHYTDSMKLKKIILNSMAAKYFTVDGSDLFFKDKKQNRVKQIIIDHEAYYGFRLLSSSMSNKLDSLDSSKLSSVDHVYIVTESNGVLHREYVEIRVDGRSGIIDQEFIKHSLSNTVLADNGNCIIDVTEYEGRVLYLENKEFAYDQFNSDFKKLLTSYATSKKVNPEKAINEIFYYLNSKLNINIKIVELLVASITASDVSENDYSVSGVSENKEVTSYSTVINERTIGVSLGFERQTALLNRPDNYSNMKFTQYHPLEDVWNTKTIKVNTNGQYN